jgi:two-component system, OmpR family, sensor histidine kinase VicK
MTDSKNEDTRLSAILSSMKEGLVMVDKKYEVMLMNQAAGALLRIAPSSARGQRIEDIFRLFKNEKRMLDSPSPIMTALKEANTIAIQMEDNVFCENKTGKLFPLVMTVNGMTHYGDIRGVIIFSDRTKEKEIDRMKTEFVSVVSHQLRTPLAAVKLFSEMMHDGQTGKLNDQQKNYVTQIQQSAERMIILVNDLLNSSRGESGKLQVRIEDTDLQNFVQDIVKECHVLGKNKACVLTFKQDGKSVYKTKADTVLFRQVIRNLIVNAIQYSPKEKCEIKIDLKKEGQEYIITVADSGIGIPKDVQPKIYERFFRAENAKRVTPDGTGLGLYTARMILEKTGGRIWFESQGEGKGTTFFVAIPIQGMKEVE